MPAWLLQIIQAILSGALLSAVVAFAMVRVQRRKTSAEAVSIEAGSAKSLFDEVSELRGIVLRARQQVDECERDGKIKDTRIARLEQAFPMAMLSNILKGIADGEKQYRGVAETLDMATDPMLIVIPADEASIVWCNRAFFEAVGRAREEVLGTAWRHFIVPEDLGRTKAVEAGMWSGDVRDFVNSWLRPDGSRVMFRWYAPQYADGVSLVLARIVPS